MPPFIHDDFLLDDEIAVDLFHRVAERLPVIDYHCHLPVEQIAGDHRFRSITEIWLDGDHYKWRAMRANGIPEKYCTGNASDWEKFEAWARTVPDTRRNALYHWTHMELRRPFGIDRLLDASSAREVYDRCNERLTEDGFTALGLLRNFKAAVVCTTDDPADGLEHHGTLARRKDPDTRVYPTWRPDKALAVEDPDAFNRWTDRLSGAVGVDVADLESFLEALDARHGAFHEAGCRLSDHGLETLHSEDFTDDEVRGVFARVRSGKELPAAEALKLKSALLHRLALLDHTRGWVQQFHLGALRNNSTRLRTAAGPDTGFDSIGDFEHARPLARFFDRLDRTDQLAKTILYNVNPRDNEVFATMCGNFQDGSVPGKMQYGSAWWFLDQLDGMTAQMNTLSNMGLLSRFVGMITDSRSFLSYSRHDYFRRLLCNLLGNDVRRELLPDDRAGLGRMVEDICFFNAREYFGLEVGRVGTVERA